MTVIDDRNYTFADVQVGQGCTHNGSFKVKVQPQSGTENAMLENGVLMQIQDTEPVSDICNIELHKKR